MPGSDQPFDNQSLHERLDVNFVLQVAGLGVWEVDPFTNQVLWDDHCRALFGLTKHNYLPYEQAIQYIHADDVSQVNQAVQWAMNPQSNGQYDQTFRTIGADDGKLRWVRFYGRAYFSGSGELYRFAGVAQEVIQPLLGQQGEATTPQEVQRQQRIYEAITASTPDLVYVFDLNYRFTYANQALLNMWGSTWEKSIGKGLLENGYEPWHAQMHEQEIDRVIATKQPIRGEVSFPHATLGKRVYDYVFAPIFNERGEVEAVAGTTRDISDIKQAQYLLQQSEEFSHSIIEHSPIAKAVFVGENMRIARINEKMLHLLGRDDSILGKPFREAMPELVATPLMDRLRHVFITGEPYEQPEERIEFVRFGQPYTGYYQYIFKALSHANGERYGMIMTATEVTQDVKNRQKLEEAEAGLRGAVELAQLGTWSIDVATNALTYSDRLIEWFGYDPAAQDYSQVIPILSAEDQDRVAAAVARALMPDSDGIYEETYAVIHPKTGQKRILHAHGKTVFDAVGKAIRLNGTAQDITLQRELQLALEREVQQRTEELAAINEELAATNEELAASNEELEEANELLLRSNDNLQQFAYVASHDLQEPLRKIQSFGDLLKSQYTASSSDELIYLERMQSAASRMSTLIRDLLNFSRISTQRDSDTLVPLNGIVEQVLITLELVIDEANAMITVEPLPTIQGDASQLTQLFQNLISNALKFQRPSVAPLIHIQNQLLDAGALPAFIKPTRAAKLYYRINVADNGIGFDEKYLDRIFQVFQRLYGKNEFAGTGIGLAICERVVSNHGGAITATSQPGQGAIFSVYLPA